ncbi:hypothetical protein RA28_19745 [Ruegeria sp. ANG-S4]|uniref:hypothetical protein n=1 Tax=Ruegeria sp. ANG-S4 TaxID=1577904 RepID=UPI0005803977|nr:hypothetical protein [Ruegeria sp. ANG-S4]KIC43859.1 hypothetical protein RA28_19745 [Ruegeria sp. ANG-S4]
MRAFEILWIVLFRFRPLSRLWAVCLILVNLASLLFLDSYYAWYNLIAVGVGVSLMIVIYLRLGFVRLLGIGHALWIPMIGIFLADMPDRSAEPALYVWLVLLIAFNTASLVIDAVDVARFALGERAPHYSWEPRDPAL